MLCVGQPRVIQKSILFLLGTLVRMLDLFKASNVVHVFAGDSYLNFMGNEFGHPEWIDFPRGDSYDNSTGAFVPGTLQLPLLLEPDHVLST